MDNQKVQKCDESDEFVALGLLDRSLNERGLPPQGVSLFCRPIAAYRLCVKGSVPVQTEVLLIRLQADCGGELRSSSESFEPPQAWFCCWWQSEGVSESVVRSAKDGAVVGAGEQRFSLHFAVAKAPEDLTAAVSASNRTAVPQLVPDAAAAEPLSAPLTLSAADGSEIVLRCDEEFSFEARFALSVGGCEPLMVRSARDDINVGNGRQGAAVSRRASGYALSIETAGGECFYGTGEDFGAFEKTGRHRLLTNADALGNHGSLCYHNLPTLFSTRGLCWSLKGDRPGMFDVAAERLGLLTICQGGDSLSGSLLARSRLGDAVRAHRVTQGRPAGVPEWSYGLWLSRCYYQDEREVREVIAEATRREVPFRAINLDARCWMKPECRTDFRPDATRFPDFMGFVRELSGRGIAVSLWENPYVSSHAELYDVGARNGFFARTREGSVYPYQWVPPGLPGFPQPPLSGLVDFTSRLAVEWWKDLHRPFLRQGVLCFKTDFGEEIPFDARFSDGRSGLDMRNEYADLYNQVVFEVVREMCGEEGVIWARSGFRRAHSHPVKWAGDGQTNWRSLRATLRAGLSQGFGGAVFWSHDGGGFYGAPPDPELYLRWVQMGLWCSHVRLHGTTAREPWCFGESVFSNLRACLKVRELLQEYWSAVGHQCVAEHRSFMQPLCLVDDQDLALRHIDDQFAVGDDLIVAPFLDASGGRTLLLPKGTWVDLRTGQISEGSCQLQTPRTPFLPVFYRQQSLFRPLFEAVEKVFRENGEHTP